jgi:hypothetical protein
MNSKENRYVLCRPNGGLNDTLVQIFLCLQYAKTNRRTLIIDTARSGIYLPFHHFFEFIRPDSSVVLELNDQLLAHLESLECHPPELRGRIGSFNTEYSGEIGSSRDTVSGISTRLDFGLATNEPLVVHENCGGGRKSIQMLGFLCLRESVAGEINRRLMLLPESYVSIHVRNTDMHCDYELFFASIAPEIAGKNVLLCSDDDKVFASASKFFGADKTINLRRVGGFDGKPLHSLGSGVDDGTKFSIVIDALTDLMAMAFSKCVYLTTSTDGHQSGFGRLGENLHSHQSLALQLMRRPVPLSFQLNRSMRQILNRLYWRWSGLFSGSAV